MPTDGTLLLEHMPNGKQYLVTALSVFFSFGAVFAAIVGLLVIPGHSCPPAPAPCNVSEQNLGWRYLLTVLGLIVWYSLQVRTFYVMTLFVLFFQTLSMFIARMVFFRLHESPRYLVHAGRPEEAIESLQLISKFNGSELALGLDDVADHHIATAEDNVQGSSLSNENGGAISVDREASVATPPTTDVLFEADSPTDRDQDQRRPRLLSQTSREALRNDPDAEQKDYNSTGNTPQDSRSGSSAGSTYSDTAVANGSARRRPPMRTEDSRRLSTASSFYEMKSKVYWKLPRWLRKPLWAWMDRIAMVLAPEWFRTTVLVWAVWCSMSLGTFLSF